MSGFIQSEIANAITPALRETLGMEEVTEVTVPTPGWRRFRVRLVRLPDKVLLCEALASP